MAAASVPQVQPPALVAALPACTAGGVSVSFDGEGGTFAGMSHNGALIVVRNIGAEACRIPGLAALRFEDAARRPLPIDRRAPSGMHPGPAVPPVGLAAGAEATAGLLWVSSRVFGDDGGRCFEPKGVVVSFDDATVTVPVSATICGPDGTPATFEQKVSTVDPVLGP